MLEEPVLTRGSSPSGTTGGASEASPTSAKARVEKIEKSIGLNRRKCTPKLRPKPEDVLPGDPKWERIGERVIRRYKGTNKPEGIWPEVWRGTSHKERNKVIKEAKDFREHYETTDPTTEASLEGIRPTDISTGEGAWPGAPAAQSAAPAHAQKEITRHIIEFCTSENSKIGDKRYVRNGCVVLRCSLKDGVTTNAGLKRAHDGVSKPGCLLWASMPCIGGSPWQHIKRHKPGGLEKPETHIKDWYKIWTAFKAVARECIKHNGHIADEWLPGCDYWKYYVVQEFFGELQLEKIKFDGCALGRCSDYNDPIRNPWCVVTTNGHIFRAFAKYSCHALVRINTLIMSHALVSIQRWPRATLGHSPMSFTRHGEIVNWKSTEVLGLARLGIFES